MSPLAASTTTYRIADSPSAPGTHTCIIGVKGGGDPRRLDVVCPPGGPCPERQAGVRPTHRGASQEPTLRSAVCLDELGADYADEVLFGNAFVAQLTFEQVIQLAAHPQVLSIATDVVTPPP